MMETKWTENQEKAITLTDRNILVSAAAGSGKTAVLVERIVSVISSPSDNGELFDIDKMVVVTFTKAAAAEMKARIRVALAKKLDDNPADKHLLRQLTLLNNAQITTIDSFCLWIIRNHFSEINLDPGFKTADEGELRLIESDVCEQLLEDYYESQDEAFLKLVDSYNDNKSDRAITDIILKLYRAARSNPWPQEWLQQCARAYHTKDGGLLESDLVKLYFESIKKSLTDYREKYERLAIICMEQDGPLMYSEAVNSDLAFLRKASTCDNFDELVSISQKFEFESLGRKKYPDVNEQKKEYVKSQRNNFKKYYSNLNSKTLSCIGKDMEEKVEKVSEVLSTLIHLVSEFLDRMSAEKRDRGIIDFNDMEHMALNILVRNTDGVKEYTETADMLAKRFTHILIDEYQDSNALQEEIMCAVSRDRLEGYKNNMYMVGDVKQSIYRFRQACPDLFVKKYDSYTRTDSEYQVIELNKNFRSRANVLNCANDVFKRVMNKNFCGIEYNKDNQLNAALEYDAKGADIHNNFGIEALGKTEIHLITPDNEQDTTKRECEAQHIAHIIKSLTEGKGSEDCHYVFDKEINGYRPVEYRDIVVLTRAVSDWADVFVDVLSDNGIPAICDASEGYFNVREIRLLLNFLAIIDNPVQDIALAAVMMSYFSNFDSADLARIRIFSKNKEYSGRSLYFQVQEIAQEKEACEELSFKCKAFIEMLEGWRIKNDYLGVYDLLWEIIFDTGYYDYVSTMPAGQRRQANLDILLEKALAFEKTSYSGLFNFLRYIDRLQKFEIDFSEGDVSGISDNLVRVMSIHKSKGLEFPVVILAGMHKKINQSDKSGRIVIDQTYGIGADYINIDKRTVSPTINKTAISRIIGRETVSEEQRILYVAMTRAREKLYMTGIVEDCDKFLSGYSLLAENLVNDDIFSYADNEDIKCYFDMVMPVALMPPENNTGIFEIKCYNNEQTIEGVSEEADNVSKESEMIDETEYVETVFPELSDYIPPKNADLKVKVTVSELKQMQHDADYEADAFIMSENVCGEERENESEEDETIVPKFISGEKQMLAANERGTAYHRVMECLDLSSVNSITDVENQIECLTEQEKLSTLQAECINPADIYKFTTLDIAARIVNAQNENNVYREQPFVFEYANQLVQGVIDLYFIEAGEITILDYKTDRVPSDNSGEEKLKQRYAIQLDYYAKALTQITGLKVKDKVIYSFALGKCINV